MPKFTNTEYKQTVESLASASKEKLNNPYYPFISQKPTTVNYYNSNGEKSSYDTGMENIYTHLGPNSPLKYNLIENFMLYGLNQATVNYDVTEWGKESEPIEGEALILPNTIIPKEGDFFCINYTSEKALFRINSVTTDTLDNNANFFKCEYKLLIPDGPGKIDDQVVETYEFMINNVGTDFKTIIRSTDYKIVQELETLLISMSEYYNELFFDSRVQSFIYKRNGSLMYDPYMIEFIRRNKILMNEKETSYIAHQMYLPKTFAIDYDKTFFRTVETKDMKKFSQFYMGIATRIDDINSLFATRSQPYFSVDYFSKYLYITKFAIFDQNVMEAIQSGKYYDIDIDRNYKYNIWIKFFNDPEAILKEDILDIARSIDYTSSMELFYYIPITMHMLQQSILTALQAMPTSK